MFQETFCPEKNLEELSACIFQALDTDQNGYVDFRELVLGLSITYAGSREHRLRWFFRLYDVNKDGVIKVQEMVNAVKSISSPIGESENITSAEDTANEMFIRMDVNRDGTIYEEEFVNCCHEDKTIFDILANKDK